MFRQGYPCQIKEVKPNFGFGISLILYEVVLNLALLK